MLNLEETLSMLYVTLQYSHGIISNIIVTHLKCTNGCTLEPQISFEVLCDLPNQTLNNGNLRNEQLCWLLITTNLSQSNSSRPKVGGEKKVWFTYHHYKLYLSCMCNCASHYSSISDSPVSVGLLDSSSRGRALPSGFSRQLFSWRLSSSWFTRGLLGTSHCFSVSGKNK